MEDCPVFSYHTDPGSCALENPLPPAIASEDVKGPMKGLPNGMQVQSGPEPASPPAGSSSLGPPDDKAAEPPKNNLKQQNSEPAAPSTVAKIPTVPVSDPSDPRPTRKPSAAKQGQGHENLYGQQLYPEVSKQPIKAAAAAPISFYTSTSVLAPAPAPTSKPDDDNAPVVVHHDGGKAVSTAYWTSGREAHEMIVIVEEVTVTADGPTVTQTEEAGAGAAATHMHYKRQQHKHHHHASRAIGGRKML